MHWENRKMQPTSWKVWHDIKANFGYKASIQADELNDLNSNCFNQMNAITEITP